MPNRALPSRGAPCTAHRSIDQIDSSPERGVYIQICGVEQVRLGGLSQRRRCSIGVALVAAPDIGQHFALADRVPGLFQLQITAPGALLRRRRHKEFHVRIGANHGANIPSIQHRAGLLPGEVTLKKLPEAFPE